MVALERPVRAEGSVEVRTTNGSWLCTVFKTVIVYGEKIANFYHAMMMDKKNFNWLG